MLRIIDDLAVAISVRRRRLNTDNLIENDELDLQAALRRSLGRIRIRVNAILHVAQVAGGGAFAGHPVRQAVAVVGEA